MVSALLVWRNSSAAMSLPSMLRVNFLLTVTPSASPQMRTAGAGRRYLGIAVAASIEEILRPHVDAVGVDVAAIVEIDRGKGISLQSACS